MPLYGSPASCIATSPFPSLMCGGAVVGEATLPWECAPIPPWYCSYVNPAGGWVEGCRCNLETSAPDLAGGCRCTFEKIPPSQDTTAAIDP
jgi:hypothetical protein